MKQLKNIFIGICYRTRGILGSVFELVFSFLMTGIGLWYTIWFSVGAVYLWLHWEQAMVFLPFNGHALIFIVWLTMIVRPFVKDFNSPWLNLNFQDFRRKQKDNRDAKKEFEERLANSQNSQSEAPHGGENG